MEGSGLPVQGLLFRVQGLIGKILNLWFRMQSVEFTV